ncbi:MAG: tetratricopeptide repeat protein [Planctomycetota bacterium]
MKSEYKTIDHPVVARRRIITKVSLSLAIIASACLAFFCIHALRQPQVHRELLQRARVLRDQGDIGRALQTMARYLELNPKDIAACIDQCDMIGQARKTHVATEEAILFHFKTMALCEASKTSHDKIPDLRVRVIELLISSGRYEEAMAEIDALVGIKPIPGLLRDMTRCRVGLLLAGRPEPVENKERLDDSEWYLAAKSNPPIDLLVNTMFDHPGDLELTRLLAEICLNRPKLIESSSLAAQSDFDIKQMALESADRLLLENENSLDAWLLHGTIAALVDPSMAESDFDRAAEMFPESIQVSRAAGLFFVNQSQREAARGSIESRDAYLERAEPLLEKYRSSQKTADLPVLAALGDLHAMRGNYQDAIQVWEQGCRTCQPPTIDLHFRIVDAQLNSGSLTRAYQALNNLDEALTQQSNVLTKETQRDLTRVTKQYWIQYAIAKGDRATLQRLLDSLVKNIATENIDTRAATIEFIAASYMKIGKWERAYAAYCDALSLRPAADRLLRGASLAAMRSNQMADSGAKLRLIEKKSFNDWVMLASMALESHRRRQNLAVLTLDVARDALVQARLVANAENNSPSNPWIIDILESELAIQMAAPEERQELIGNVSKDLVAICDADSDAVDLWQTAIVTLNRWGQRTLADGLMERFVLHHPDHEFSIVKRARSLATSQSREIARGVVWSALQEKPNSDTLLQGYFELSDASPAWAAEVDALIARLNDDADRLAMLGRMAIKVPFPAVAVPSQERKSVRNDDAPWTMSLKRIEERLRTIEGNEGIEWRTLRAQRLLRLAEVDAKPDWGQIRELAKYLTVKQPSLPIGYKLSGIVLDKAKKPSEALTMFQNAISLGEADVRIFERTCELLHEEGKFDEARTLIEQLGTRTNASARVESIALQLSGDQPEQLLDIAKAGVEARPSDPMAWVWYATVLVSTSRTATEEEQRSSMELAHDAIDRAVFLAPNDLRVVNAEFHFYTVTNQTDKYARPMERLKNNESIPSALRYVALGRMEYASGALEESIACFRSAIESGADEVAVSLLIAQSLRAQRKIGLAIDTLEAAYKKAPQQAEVRRMLASTLAIRGNATDWSRLQLILTARPSANTDQDLQLLATLYAQRGFPSDLAKAKSILDQSISKSSAPTGEELYRVGMISYRAALLHEESDQTQKGQELRSEAEAHLRSAIAKEPVKPVYRQVYANLLLDSNQSHEALNQAKTLLHIDSESFESHLIMARTLKAKGEMLAAIATLEEWLDTQRIKHLQSRSEDKILGAIGSATAGFMVLGLHEQAMQLLKEMETISEAASLDVLTAMTSAEDVTIRSMAIELLLEKAKEHSADATKRSRIAVAVANAMIGRKMGSSQKSNGEAFLVEVQSENPSQLAIQQIITNYWILQNNIQRSIEGLRTILKITPDDPVALNNLACALGESDSGTAEGLILIDRAMTLVGELPDLLDTKGTLLMRSGNINDAIDKFEAAAKAGQDPRIVLHWYIALRRGNRLKAAKLVQSRIDVERLRRASLSDEEQKELRVLQ